MHRFGIELNVKLPVFAKGEIVFYEGIMKGDEIVETYSEFVKSESFNKEIIIDKTNLIKNYKDDFTSSELIGEDDERWNSPYCTHYKYNLKCSSKVNEKVSDFLGKTCFFFIQYRESIENEAFNNVFKSQMEKKNS